MIENIDPVTDVRTNCESVSANSREFRIVVVTLEGSNFTA
jgi:hypothetical protein